MAESKPPQSESKMEERGQRVESLGWITESGVMPKKQRVIEGVGASSAVELRAQLYKSQEEYRRTQEGGLDGEEQRARKRTGLKGPDIFAQRNAGVEERAQRDKLQLKAAESGADSYAALERKAQLYQQLLRGEVPDEEDKEKYSVDFLRKGFLEEEKEEMEREGRGEVGPADGERDGGARAGEDERKGTAGRGGSHTEHKQFIREVNKQTKEAREQAAVLKHRRQSQAERNREKLRQAFLKKQAEKLLAARQKQKQMTHKTKRLSGDIDSEGSIRTQT